MRARHPKAQAVQSESQADEQMGVNVHHTHLHEHHTHLHVIQRLKGRTEFCFAAQSASQTKKLFIKSSRASEFTLHPYISRPRSK